jgi:oligo-1,6-glucosidase/alpha-glucosidase
VGFLRKRGILLNRDECRLPMRWDDGPNAGFAPATATPWLPIPPESPSLNVAAQQQDPASLLNCYRGLLALRREHPALHAGALELRQDPRYPAAVVAYRRTYGEGAAREVVDVLLNFSRREVALDLGDHAGRQLYSNRRGEVETVPAQRTLGAYEGLVIFDPR